MYNISYLILILILKASYLILIIVLKSNTNTVHLVLF